MAGFREINGLKNFIVKFDAEYKNCIKLHEPNKFYDLKPLPLHLFAKGLVQIRDHNKSTSIQIFQVVPTFLCIFEGCLTKKFSVLNFYAFPC